MCVVGSSYLLIRIQNLTTEGHLTVFPKIVSPVGSPRIMFWNECVIFAYPNKSETKGRGCKFDECRRCKWGSYIHTRVHKKVIIAPVQLHHLRPNLPQFKNSTIPKNRTFCAIFLCEQANQIDETMFDTIVSSHWCEHSVIKEKRVAERSKIGLTLYCTMSRKI